MKRRQFLLAGAASVGALWLPRAAQAADYQRLLVVVELKGGNDGLNTVVPYADRAYAALRPRIAVPRDNVLQLDERTGLHPALKELMPLWEARELAIVQGVGYPRPNLSHFRSIEIWDTASRSDEYLAQGWLARCFAAHRAPVTFAADGIALGAPDSGPLGGGGARVVVLSNLETFQRQARLATRAAPAGNAALAHILSIESDIVTAASRLASDRPLNTRFPRGPLGDAAHVCARIAANESGVAAIRLSLPGFDTHQNQPGVHARLLGEFAQAMAALRSALIETGRWNSTLVMTYSEFGRRAQENQSNGTDHGTASAHFLMGGRVRGGLHGAAPRLSALEGGNLVHAVDFRSLYATALERWWRIPSSSVLNGRFEPLDLVRA